eukprot:g5546.t1
MPRGIPCANTAHGTFQKWPRAFHLSKWPARTKKIFNWSPDDFKRQLQKWAREFDEWTTCQKIVYFPGFTAFLATFRFLATRRFY